jgi:hypothetical protein
VLLGELSAAIFLGRFFVVDVASCASPDAGNICSLGPSEDGSPFNTNDPTGFSPLDTKLRIDACMVHDVFNTWDLWGGKG